MPESDDDRNVYHLAYVHFSLYPDGPTAYNCSGVFGHKSILTEEKAALVHVKAAINRTVNTGCHASDNAPSDQPWIALVQRGDCKFDVKVYTAARSNASAVVVYNFKDEDEILVMAHEDHGIVTVMIGKDCGEAVASLADHLEENGTMLYVSIVPSSQSVGGGTDPNAGENFTRTSVLIVSITFIVLMIFSLAWLVFYYVQRFRFANMKDRITRQLAEAAKRAIKRIPKRSVCQADMVENNVCAVCIESYKDSDVVRELPCSHIFHKQCIDHWLIEKRVCPMCKLNILEALGVRVKGVTSTSDAASAVGSRDGESGTWDIPMTTFLVSPSQAPRNATQLRGDVEADASQCDESMSLVGDSPAHHGGLFVSVPVASAHLSSPNIHVHQ